MLVGILPSLRNCPVQMISRANQPLPISNQEGDTGIQCLIPGISPEDFIRLISESDMHSSPYITRLW